MRRSLAQTNDGPVPAAPKSRRRIKLTGTAVEALKRHRATQNAERLRLGSLWEDRGLVFPNRTGGFLSPYLLTDGPLKRPPGAREAAADPLPRLNQRIAEPVGKAEDAIGSMPVSHLAGSR